MPLNEGRSRVEQAWLILWENEINCAENLLRACVRARGAAGDESEAPAVIPQSDWSLGDGEMVIRSTCVLKTFCR